LEGERRGFAKGGKAPKRPERKKDVEWKAAGWSKLIEDIVHIWKFIISLKEQEYLMLS
jgi:hypothetical protein